jgi:hypothetical protein
MMKSDVFQISRKPYAADLTSLRVIESFPTGAVWAVIDAVWFRGTKKKPYACVCELKTVMNPPPKTAKDFLTQYADNRYGGECLGRWNGTGYYGSQVPGVMEGHLALLKPMLENFPAVPEGYDGWWVP